jgi:hypothetical protein
MTDQGIKAQIDAAFRKARLERDEPTKLVIGMLKSKVLLELKSGSGVTEDDELWLRNVAAYAKQVRKTIAELEPLGAQAAQALAEARFELEFCERFLPKKLTRPRPGAGPQAAADSITDETDGADGADRRTWDKVTVTCPRGRRIGAVLEPRAPMLAPRPRVRCRTPRGHHRRLHGGARG